MKLKNYLIIFTLFLVLMCCVNAINASPNDKLDMNVLELDSSVDYISISNEEQASSENNEVIGIAVDSKDTELAASNSNTSQKSVNGADVGTFTDLKKLIESSKDEVSLSKNYTFNRGVDKDLTFGIVISKPIKIYGNGVTINGDSNARIFQIDADDVTITEINLINGREDMFGGAIYWSGKGGVIEKSNLTHNIARSGGAIFVKNGGVLINNNRFESNYANNRGGAIMVVGYHTSITNNLFKDNHALRYDPAVHYQSFAMIDKYDGNDFINNTKIVLGGGSDSDSTNHAISNEQKSVSSNKYSKIIVSSNNKEMPINNNQLTLDILNKIFNQDFTNGFLLVYIDGKLVFNGTTTSDLTLIICNLLALLAGQHEISVEFTGNDGKTNSYKENIILEE